MNHSNFSTPNLIIIGITVFLIIFTFNTILKSDDNILRRKFVNGFAIYLVGILGFSTLCMIGFFSQNTVPPRFPLFFIFNFTFMFLLIFQKKRNTGFFSGIPLSLLVYVQSFRLVLEMAIYLFHQEGITPRELTFTGRSFDLFVGISAIPAGYYLSKGYRKIGLLFNVFGLLSLTNIIYLAIFSFPTPFRIFTINYLPSYFPGIMVPLYIAPTAIFFHVISLIQIFSYKSLRSNPMEEEKMGMQI